MLYKALLIILLCAFPYCIHSCNKHCIHLIDKITKKIPKTEIRILVSLGALRDKVEPKETKSKHCDSDSCQVGVILAKHINPYDAQITQWKRVALEVFSGHKLEKLIDDYEQREKKPLKKSKSCVDLSTVGKQRDDEGSGKKQVRFKNKWKALKKFSPVGNMKSKSSEVTGYALWIKQLQEANK